MKHLVLLATMLSLAGCVSTSDQEKAELDASPAPASIKAAIANGARAYVSEPAAARNAEISTMPFDMLRNRHYVCVRADVAASEESAYGRKAMAVFVRNERPVATSLNDPLCARPGLRWEPFPELEALQRS